MISGAEFNVLDFGADPTGNTPSTDAIQSTIDAAITAGGGEIFFPRGTYNVSQLTISSSAVAITLCGVSTSVYSSNSGSTLIHTGSAVMIVTDGLMAQGNLKFENLNFTGIPSSLGAISFKNSTFCTVNGCVFKSFTNVSASVLSYTDTGGATFVGVMQVSNSVFSTNTQCIFLANPDSNLYNIDKCTFSACTNGIKLGVIGAAFACTTFNVNGCHFEGNTGYDIVSAGGMQGFNIVNNYFEQPVGGTNNQSIYIGSNVSSPINSGVLIQGNTFAKQILAAGQSIIFAQQVINLNINSNFCNYGGSSDRYFLDGPQYVTGSNSWAVDTASTLTGVTPYPMYVNLKNIPSRSTDRSGAKESKAWVSFTGATGAIRAGDNVASVTRAGVGQYTINFINALQDTNYVAVISCNGSIGVINAQNLGNCTLLTYDFSAVAVDPSFVNVLIFGPGPTVY